MIMNPIYIYNCFVHLQRLTTSPILRKDCNLSRLFLNLVKGQSDFQYITENTTQK
jgi:hypothetical protein